MKTHCNYVSLRYYDYILFLYHIIKTTCFFFRTKKADFKGRNMLSWSLTAYWNSCLCLNPLSPEPSWTVIWSVCSLCIHRCAKPNSGLIFPRREKWFSLELQAWFVYLGGIFVCAKKRKKFSLAIIKFYRDCLPFTWVDWSAHCFRRMVKRINNR